MIFTPLCGVTLMNNFGHHTSPICTYFNVVKAPTFVVEPSSGKCNDRSVIRMILINDYHIPKGHLRPPFSKLLSVKICLSMSRHMVNIHKLRRIFLVHNNQSHCPCCIVPMKLYSSSFYRLDDTFEHQNIHNLLKGKKLGANGLHFIKADSVSSLRCKIDRLWNNKQGWGLVFGSR
jgi:hypothetical protein